MFATTRAPGAPADDTRRVAMPEPSPSALGSDQTTSHPLADPATVTCASQPMPTFDASSIGMASRDTPSGENRRASTARVEPLSLVKTNKRVPEPSAAMLGARRVGDASVSADDEMTTVAGEQVGEHASPVAVPPSSQASRGQPGTPGSRYPSPQPRGTHAPAAQM